ncbi:MAG: hypothetical protein SGJ20_19590, partial [Planctomycetota bacterium]|nr:hypothetical protein [Planctomycetota bacterium]
QLGWAGLSGGSFTSAALEIAAFGVTGSDDDVFIGVNLDQFVGTLTNGEWYTAFFSISTFDLTVHLALLNDFTLEVLIDKNGFLGGPSTIFTSTLTATYETGNVPEPASIAVWSALAAIGGVVTWRKRKMLHAA